VTQRNQYRQPAAVFATDSYPLGGTWHVPPGEVKAAALFAGAMGVKSRYYAAFADHLAAQGIGVLTVDYRGVGLSRTRSLRGFRAGMMDWAEGDLQGAVNAVQAKWPGKPLHWVAHSLGGQLMGFVEAPIRRALFVASQSGYWGHWPGSGKILMAGLWHVAIPTLVRVTGRLPMQLAGQGEDVPAGVGADWARWGRHRRYFGPTIDAKNGAQFNKWEGELRAYHLTDDWYAPVSAVHELVSTYSRARSEVKLVRPQDVGAKRVGHFGFFRPEFRPTLWTEAADWLLRS
jgi:predicted alpha/beta hydrolase